MVKLWKCKVNNYSWDYPNTIYATSREAAEQKRKQYPAADRVEYAGMFTNENAKILLCTDAAEEYFYYVKTF